MCIVERIALPSDQLAHEYHIELEPRQHSTSIALKESRQQKRMMGFICVVALWTHRNVCSTSLCLLVVYIFHLDSHAFAALNSIAMTLIYAFWLAFCVFDFRNCLRGDIAIEMNALKYVHRIICRHFNCSDQIDEQKTQIFWPKFTFVHWFLFFLRFNSNNCSLALWIWCIYFRLDHILGLKLSQSSYLTLFVNFHGIWIKIERQPQNEFINAWNSALNYKWYFMRQFFFSFQLY